MLHQSTVLRLETQLDVVPLLLADMPAEALMAGPPAVGWSAHENLAHLARHHAVCLDRLRRVLHEHKPQLGRYRAEADPVWPEWSALSTAEVLSRLQILRADLIQLVKGLSAEEASRIGLHPLFGEMGLDRWIEFFLLHEAHHLYMVMIRLGQAKRASGSAPTP
jgi:hypothetical protein